MSQIPSICLLLFGTIVFINGLTSHALFAVSTACLSPISPQIYETLKSLQHTSKGLFSVLIMCYDIPKSPTLFINLSNQRNSSYSFAQACFEVEMSLFQDECVLYHFLPTLSIKVVPTSLDTTKLFKPNPRSDGILLASKIQLWKHHLTPELLSKYLVLFAWDDDIVPDKGFSFSQYVRWVLDLNLGISQPMISSNGHFKGSGLSLADWTPPVPQIASVKIIEQMAPVYAASLWSSCLWPLIARNQTFHTGWGLEALHLACVCHGSYSQVPLLSVVAGCGSVAHRDLHSAKLFSKRRRKGIVEKTYYENSAKLLVGGLEGYSECERRGSEKVQYMVQEINETMRLVPAS